jgi:hypothetical protein
MSYQNELGLETIESKIFEFLWALVFVSPVIVSISLIIVFVKWRKKYQWLLGRFLRYVFLGGVIGFVVTFVYVVTWTIMYNSPQGPLGIFFFGPPFFALGELAGFGLFAWLEARKRRKAQGKPNPNSISDPSRDPVRK